MARGNARQKIVRDDADRGRLIDGVEQAVVRQAWESHRREALKRVGIYQVEMSG